MGEWVVRQIIVVPYQTEWPAAYEREKALLTATLGAVVLASHHIGSTAIPGMWAKPIIDILLVVTSLDTLDLLDDDMIALAYLPRGENGIPGRRYYRKGSEAVHTHHVHAYEAGHHDIERHLLFRDYMACHPDQAQAYCALKRDLAARYHDDAESYVAGKDAFIKEMDRQAAAWRRSTQDAMGGL
jgi:GrpB-like predicted nucleotidyltransferase (UPF0157 family)